MSGLQRHELYGGAMSLEIPSRLVDISAFRQVPDHQEVFADADTDQSVIVEINEYASMDHEEAFTLYWNDIVEINEASSHEILNTNMLLETDLHVMQNIRSDYGNHAGYIVGKQRVRKFKEDLSASNEVEVFMLVLRLASVQSDIIITINSPSSIAAESSSAHCAVTAPEVLRGIIQNILGSFTIHDWGLFIN